jgi:hypothetical protein
MTDQGVKHVAALARPVKPGMLYDCRSDTLLLGVTLWSNEVIEKSINKNKTEYAEFEILLSDHMEAKAKALDMSAELSMSAMCGLVKVGGSASFIEEESSDFENSRVTLHYKCLSEFHSLTMDSLWTPEYVDVFNDGTATHVCTGVQYGMEVFFVFERDMQGFESKHHVSGRLAASVGAFKKSVELGEIDIEEQRFRDSVSCQYIGDFVPKKRPKSYDEAKNLLGDLPKLIREADPKAKRIYLYPLSKLNPQAAKLVTAINENTVSRVIELIQHFNGLKRQVQAILDKVIDIYFLHDEGEKLKNIIKLASTMFKNEIKLLIPKIRGGEVDELVLKDIIDKWHNSQYSPKVLSENFKILKKHFYTVSMLVGAGESIGAVSKIGKDPTEFAGMIEGVIAFTFNSKVFKNAGLDHTYTSLLNNDFVSSDFPSCNKIKSKELKKMNEIFKLFVGYSQVNKHKRFVIFCDEDCSEEDAVAFITFRLWDSCVRFQLPSIPALLNYIEGSITSTSLAREIPPPEVREDSYKLTMLERESSDWSKFLNNLSHAYTNIAL